jgi:hypothetical protein
MDRRREQPPAIVVLFAIIFILLVGPIAVISAIKEHDEKTSIPCSRIATTMDFAAYYCLIFNGIFFGFVFLILLQVAITK